jgi:hypothetical protein
MEQRVIGTEGWENASPFLFLTRTGSHREATERPRDAGLADLGDAVLAARLIAFLTELITLEAGDVVTTGTPAGVGCFRKPPAYLQPGTRSPSPSTHR